MVLLALYHLAIQYKTDMNLAGNVETFDAGEWWNIPGIIVNVVSSSSEVAE